MANTIRKYRLQAGMDQAELAETLGFTKTAVGNWELGLTRPDPDTIPHMCELLGMPVTELLDLPPETALPSEDRSLLDSYHMLNKYSRKAVDEMIAHLLFLQDRRESTLLRESYRPLCLYEEAAAAGVGTPMQDDAGSKTVYLPKQQIPAGADFIIHVNGNSMKPDYPNGAFVYAGSAHEVAPGQVGIFIVNGESYIKEYQPEGLVSRNRRYPTIRVEGADVRCCGRVLGIVKPEEIASGSLLEKIETAFQEAGEFPAEQ